MDREVVLLVFPLSVTMDSSDVFFVCVCVWHYNLWCPGAAHFRREPAAEILGPHAGNNHPGGEQQRRSQSRGAVHQWLLGATNSGHRRECDSPAPRAVAAQRRDLLQTIQGGRGAASTKCDRRWRVVRMPSINRQVADLQVEDTRPSHYLPHPNMGGGFHQFAAQLWLVWWRNFSLDWLLPIKMQKIQLCFIVFYSILFDLFTMYLFILTLIHNVFMYFISSWNKVFGTFLTQATQLH